MPGTIIALDAARQHTGHAGAALVVVEAMKMEHVLAAPIDGAVNCLSVGQQVAVDQLLLTVHPDTIEGTQE